MDKATASTKISGEQCTWPDSDRVKCHCSLPVLPSLRRVALSCSLADSFPISLVLAAFLLPSVLFYRVCFPFLTTVRGEFGIRQYGIGALNGAITIGSCDTETDRNRGPSRYYSSFFIALVRDACRRYMRLSIATKHNRRERSQRAVYARPVVDPFLPRCIAHSVFLLLLVIAAPLLLFCFTFLPDNYILVFLVLTLNFDL